jgi:RNA polymerase sigma factor (sigma-70 family)
MVSGSSSPLLRLICSAAEDPSTGAVPDQELLRRFAADGDRDAFLGMLRRHGSMVFDVCRSVLGNEADAEDAFQATFLVLAHRARSVRTRTALGSWLHGVARRAALKALARSAARHRHEVRVPERSAPAPDELSWREVRCALHEELNAVPEQFRAPLVMCFLEGATQAVAAARLGVARSTLRVRLERGLALLRARLVRRGLGPVAVLVAVTGPTGPAAAQLPAELVSSTVEAAASVAAGNVVASDSVVTLTHTVLRATTPNKASLALAAALVALGAILAAVGAPAAQPGAANAPPSGAAPQGEPVKKQRVDALGDPLPAHAVARLGTLRFRAEQPIGQVAVVPGGKQILAVGQLTSTVHLWDAATGTEVRRFEVPGTRTAADGYTGGAWVASFALSPDGKTLAVGTSDNSNDRRGCPIVLFDFATGRKLGEWVAPRTNLRSTTNRNLTFLTATQLASVNADGVVSLWDVTTQREIRQLKTGQNPEFGDYHSKWTLAAGPGGKLLFALGGSNDQNDDESFWVVWEVASGRELHREKGLAGRFITFALSPDGTSLAVCRTIEQAPVNRTIPGTTEVRVYAGPEWREQRRWTAHEGTSTAFKSVAFSPDSKTIATIGVDAKVRLWNAGTGKPVGPVLEPDANHRYPYANQVAFLDPDTLMTFGSMNAIKFWDVASGKPKRDFPGSDTSVSLLAYSPDGRHVAVGGHDSTFSVYDLASGKPVRMLHNGSTEVTCLAFSPDGQQLVSGDRGFRQGGIKVWAWMTENTPGRTVSESGTGLWVAAFSPDGTRIASGEFAPGAGESGVVRVREMSSGKLVQESKAHKGSIAALVFAPDGKSLLSSSLLERGIHQWDLATGREQRFIKVDPRLSKPKREPVGRVEHVSGLALSPAGHWLYSSTDDLPSICVWEARSGQLARVLLEPDPEHRTWGGVKALAVSGDGTRLAAALRGESQQSLVHLWNLTTGKKIAALPGHRGPVNTVAFSPDGSRLASGSADTTVLIWDLTQLNASAAVPDEKVLARLWSDLGSSDPKVVYAAVCLGAGGGDATVTSLKAELKPIAAHDAQKVAGLVRQLESDEFATRERATKELVGLGPGATPALAAALKASESPEVRTRLARVLDAYPAALHRHSLAVEVLEMIGTSAARELLTDLSRGESSAGLTREALAALKRLEKRR